MHLIPLLSQILNHSLHHRHDLPNYLHSHKAHDQIISHCLHCNASGTKFDYCNTSQKFWPKSNHQFKNSAMIHCNRLMIEINPYRLDLQLITRVKLHVVDPAQSHPLFYFMSLPNTCPRQIFMRDSPSTLTAAHF